jgi:hypothetical protein
MKQKTAHEHNGFRGLILLFFVAALPCFATAQTDTLKQEKIITNAKTVGVGATNILDTYLSPEKYNGTEVRYMSHTTRERIGRPLSRELIHQADIAFANNRAGEGEEIAGAYRFNYGWHYNWHFFGSRLDVKAGGMTDFNLGFIYNTRNSNNPAQLRAYFNITPSAAATWHFKMWHKPFALRYEIGVPVLGVMFSPNYGQSYYEIFSEGNYDHNIVITSVGNAPSMSNMLSLDFRIGHSTFRIGYLGDFNQARVNGLKSHIYSHTIMIGFVKHFQILNIKP